MFSLKNAEKLGLDEERVEAIVKLHKVVSEYIRHMQPCAVEDCCFHHAIESGTISSPEAVLDSQELRGVNVSVLIGSRVWNGEYPAEEAVSCGLLRLVHENHKGLQTNRALTPTVDAIEAVAKAKGGLCHFCLPLACRWVNHGKLLNELTCGVCGVKVNDRVSMCHKCAVTCCTPLKSH
jgi:hypothetical protein